MKISVKQMSEAAIMLALIMVTKYIDLVIPKTPLGYSWIEMYMIVIVIMVLICPMPVVILLLFTSPFLWFVLGQTMQQSPLSFFLDYSLPVFAMILIYPVRWIKNKWIAYPALVTLIAIAFILKQFCHTLSGMIAWETPFWASFTMNVPMVFVTMSVVMGISVFLYPFNTFKLIAINYSNSWNVDHKNGKIVNEYFDDYKTYTEITGHFNKNFKVTTSKGTFHLKIFKNGEHKILKWIDGETPDEWNKINLKLLKKALDNLKPKQVPNMNYEKLKIKDVKFNELLNKYNSNKFVYCHNDINKDNVIISGSKLTIIDFEFERINHPYWEWANIVNEDNVEPKLIIDSVKLDEVTLQDWIYINRIYNNAWKKKYFNKNWWKNIKAHR